MNRIPHLILVAVIAVIAGCSAGSDDASQLHPMQSCEEYPQDSWRARYLELGRETYEKACASCHDKKVDGAPLKGEPDTWRNRSPLWAAVLLEHAKSGYLEMPPRGGQLELSDRAVEAAGEYMLNETFPELLRD